MTVLDTISKLQEHDEPTARLLLEFALYESLCSEIDQIRPHLEADVAKAMQRQAARGLMHLAEQEVTPERAEVAEVLYALVSKSAWDSRDWHGNDPDERDAATGRFKRKNGGIRQGIFNALGFATGEKDQGMEDRAHGALSPWAGPNADKYSRARAMGDALVSTENGRPAGTVLRLIGDIGPEAQKHLEPGIRRTAYRYRGTERRPDGVAQRNARLIAMAAAGEQIPDDHVATVARWQAEVADQQLGETSRLLGSPKGKGPRGPKKDVIPMEAAALEAVPAGWSPDRKRLAALGDYGAMQLVGQIPDKESASISLAAGKMPPSVGLMFDSRGALVSEAMGFNGDHYLPFDLKNLKRLKGGQYVRTRTTGGLTDEDIYAGLMTGARQVQVVSNSGVFTIEFDPKLRGGRRYSDKARQMVDRYARLVGAIGSGKLYQNQLPRDEVQAIRQKALKDSHGNPENADKLFRERVATAQAASAFLGRSDDDLMADAEERVKASGANHSQQSAARAVREEFNALKAAEMETATRRYQLDGAGYKAAMKALKQEFPYFIRSARAVDLQEFLETRRQVKPEDPRRPRGGTDLGYTERGGLDPSKSGVRNKEGGRDVLGGPDPRVKTHGQAPTPETPAAGGGTAPSTGAAPAAGAPAQGQPGSQDRIAVALQEKASQLNSALQSSLKAIELSGADGQSPYAEPMRKEDGSPIPEQTALNELPDAYAKWLIESQGSWSKVAAWLLKPDTNPAHLKKTIEAVDRVGQIARTGGSQLYPEKAFVDAKQVLEDIAVLREPFREAGDLYAEPTMDETSPPLIPEIASLELTEDALEGFAGTSEEHAEAVEQAKKWKALSHEQIRGQIATAASEYRQLKRWADAGMDDAAKPTFTVTPEHEEETKNIMSMKEDAPSAASLRMLNKAWALKRMGELLKATGAADPFAKGLRPRSKASSSLVIHDRDSAVAKALAARLARPSLRPVRPRG